eukprot:g4081.t1
MEDFPLIRELDGLFRQDPDIDELGIIFSVAPPAPAPVEPTPTKGQPPPSHPSATAAAADTASAAGPSGGAAEPQFILQEHKLGVSVHSIHPLVNEARAAFPAARREYRRLKQVCAEALQGRGCNRLEQDQDGQTGTNESSTGTAGAGSAAVAAAAAAAERLLSVTRALLLVNADHGSAWNARKEVAVDGLWSIAQEMKLLNLIFTKHAKSPNAWAHRRWCWRNNKNGRTTVDAAEEIADGLQHMRQQGRLWQPLDVGEELRVCQRVAELYPKNYYAWTQRSWVVLRVVGGNFRGVDAGAGAGAGAGDGSKVVRHEAGEGEDSTPSMTLAEELLRSEVSFVDKWLTSHVSDHSALNHRKNVVSALVAISSVNQSRLDVLEKERSSNSKLLRDYPGHESLWCYRRFVCQAFLIITPRGALLGTGAAAAARQAAEARLSVGNATPPAVDNGVIRAIVEDPRIEGDLEGLEEREGNEGGGGGGGAGGRTGGRDPSDDRDGSLSTGAATGDTDTDKPPAVAAFDRYDWARWSRAATEWHEGCVLDDAKASAVLDSSEEEVEEDEEDGVDEEGEHRRGKDEQSGGYAVESGGIDFEEADGALPGAPAGGGQLAEFLGREARFALKCATDKGAWQFEQQQRHALAHLAFVSYAADRILGSSSSSSSSRSNRHHQPQQQQQLQQLLRQTTSGREVDEDSATGAQQCEGVGQGGTSFASPSVRGSCLTYCEVTGAPKLAFPLVGTCAARAAKSREGFRPVGGVNATISSAAGTGGEGARRCSSVVGGRQGAGEGGASSDDAVAEEEEEGGGGEEEAALRAACGGLEALNAFVCGLAIRGDSVEAEAAGGAGSRRRRSGGVAPYTIRAQEQE